MSRRTVCPRLASVTVPPSGRSFTATGSMAPISVSVFVTAEDPKNSAGYPARFALMPVSLRPDGFGVRSWTERRFSCFFLTLRRITESVRRRRPQQSQPGTSRSVRSPISVDGSDWLREMRGDQFNGRALCGALRSPESMRSLLCHSFDLNRSSVRSPPPRVVFADKTFRVPASHKSKCGMAQMDFHGLGSTNFRLILILVNQQRIIRAVDKDAGNEIFRPRTFRSQNDCDAGPMSAE